MKLQKLLQQNNTIFKKGVKIVLLLFFTPFFLFADAHIFVYHRFGDNRHKSTNISIKELKKEFEYFKKHNYKVIKLSTLIKAIKDKKKIDDRWIVLTIDDSYKSFYENGLDIFKKYDYPFTIFVYVKSVDKNYGDFTTWKQLKEIAKYGEIAYHSYSHPHMTQKSDQYLKNNFAKGLKIFENKMGFKPKYFAYPYGEFDDRVKKIAQKFNFHAILNQNIGAINNYSDIFSLDRIALTGKSNLKRDLSYKHLNLRWIYPKSFPTNGILKQIVAKLDCNKTVNINYYISHYGWHKAKAKNGFIKIKLNNKLSNGRNRIIIKLNNKIDTKLLIKDKYEHK